MPPAPLPMCLLWTGVGVTGHSTLVGSWAVSLFRCELDTRSRNAASVMWEEASHNFLSHARLCKACRVTLCACERLRDRVRV